MTFKTHRIVSLCLAAVFLLAACACLHPLPLPPCRSRTTRWPLRWLPQFLPCRPAQPWRSHR